MIKRSLIVLFCIIVAAVAGTFLLPQTTSIHAPIGKSGEILTDISRGMSTSVPPIDPQDVPHRISLAPILRGAMSAEQNSELTGSTNMLLAGIPGKGNPAPNLTDTILVAHLDHAQSRVTLFSLPRDLLVRAPDASYYTKLNGLYERGGITSLRLKAEDITGLSIERYAIADLTAVKEVVDSLGGVNVFVEKDIEDPRFPDDGVGYEPFSLTAGWRYMDGRTASRYIRTRNDAEGDFGRMRRQQNLLEALRQKITGLSFVWDMPAFITLSDSLENHIKTNFRPKEMLAFATWAKTLTSDRVTIAPLDADKEKQLFTTGFFMFGEARADVVKPIEGIESYAAVREYVKTILEDTDHN